MKYLKNNNPTPKWKSVIIGDNDFTKIFPLTKIVNTKTIANSIKTRATQPGSKIAVFNEDDMNKYLRIVGLDVLLDLMKMCDTGTGFTMFGRRYNNRCNSSSVIFESIAESRKISLTAKYALFKYLENSDIWELNDNHKKTLKSYNKMIMSKLQGMCLFLCELCLYFVK